MQPLWLQHMPACFALAATGAKKQHAAGQQTAVTCYQLCCRLAAEQQTEFVHVSVLLRLQARMDVEPLVREERRNVSLEPLAAAFASLQQLCVSDATFTREPWSLQQLAWLPKLSNLSLAWDTGLWAPGQVLQEADALQVCILESSSSGMGAQRNAPVQPCQEGLTLLLYCVAALIYQPADEAAPSAHCVCGTDSWLVYVCCCVYCSHCSA